MMWLILLILLTTPICYVQMLPAREQCEHQEPVKDWKDNWSMFIEKGSQ